jgi:NADPH:quinone reductase-like Zn-dependent oxidoreductase
MATGSQAACPSTDCILCGVHTQSNDRSYFLDRRLWRWHYSIDLSGRVAFITGASSGLGAQFARTLSRAGAAVVLASRRLEKLKELARRDRR